MPRVLDNRRMTWGPAAILRKFGPICKRRHDGWEPSELTGRRSRPGEENARMMGVAMAGA